MKLTELSTKKIENLLSFFKFNPSFECGMARNSLPTRHPVHFLFVLLAHVRLSCAQTATCGDKTGDGTAAVSDADCGTGYIYDSSKSGYICNANPCVANGYGSVDNLGCCTDDPSAITPFPCNSYSELGGPLVIAVTATGWGLYRMNRYTGSYILVYNLVSTVTSPPMEVLGACGLNPIDKIVYCMVQLSGPDYYIVRLDATRVEFLYKVSRLSLEGAGTVDYDGA